MVFLALAVGLLVLGALCRRAPHRDRGFALLCWSAAGGLVGSFFREIAVPELFEVQLGQPTFHVPPDFTGTCGTGFVRYPILVQDRLTGATWRSFETANPSEVRKPPREHLEWLTPFGTCWGAFIGLLAGGWVCRREFAQRTGAGEQFLRELAEIHEPESRGECSEQIQRAETQLKSANPSRTEGGVGGEAEPPFSPDGAHVE